MGNFLRHEPCPECRKYNRDNKGNNLGVWSDHKYCFSCGYKEGGDILGNFRKQFHTVELPLSVNNLPQDTVVYLRKDASTWIKSYGLTNAEMVSNNICWSEKKELLIFPFYDDQKELIAWNARYFGSNKDYPKYVTYGIRQNLFHYIGKGDTVVLVEDIISAIKVGRHIVAMPLFSSDANKYQLYRISQRYDNLLVWLDPDKRGHSLKLGHKALSFFKEVNTICSDKDPKYYSDEEIQYYIKRLRKEWKNV